MHCSTHGTADYKSEEDPDFDPAKEEEENEMACSDAEDGGEQEGVDADGNKLDEGKIDDAIMVARMISYLYFNMK